MTKEKHVTPDPVEQHARSMPFYKKLIFSLLPLAILLILLETGARLVYYQEHGHSSIRSGGGFLQAQGQGGPGRFHQAGWRL